MNASSTEIALLLMSSCLSVAPRSALTLRNWRVYTITLESEAGGRKRPLYYDDSAKIFFHNKFLALIEGIAIFRSVPIEECDML